MAAPIRKPSHQARMRYVDERLTDLGAERVRKAQAVAGDGAPDLISGALLLALGLRESGLRNVGGDIANGHAHARGCFQIHDRYHADWLRSVPGCRMATTIASHTSSCWVPVKGKTALDVGYCPTFQDGARGAALILRSYIEQAESGVAFNGTQVTIRIAVAAYNCGLAAALRGWRAGDVDVHTTGQNYSEDCLLRRSEVQEWLRDHPAWLSHA